LGRLPVGIEGLQAGPPGALNGLQRCLCHKLPARPTLGPINRLPVTVENSRSSSHPILKALTAPNFSCRRERRAGRRSGQNNTLPKPRGIFITHCGFYSVITNTPPLGGGGRAWVHGPPWPGRWQKRHDVTVLTFAAPRVFHRRGWTPTVKVVRVPVFFPASPCCCPICLPWRLILPIGSAARPQAGPVERPLRTINQYSLRGTHGPVGRLAYRGAWESPNVLVGARRWTSMIPRRRVSPHRHAFFCRRAVARLICGARDSVVAQSPRHSA